MTNTVKKPTKKTSFSTIDAILTLAEQNGFQLPDEMTYEDLHDFVAHEIELLDNKAAAAAKRAADKKVAGDALREKIFGVLTETPMTIKEIVAAVDDPDVSAQMVTSRLSQLAELGRVVKDSVSVPAATEGGKAKKLVAYKVA